MKPICYSFSGLQNAHSELVCTQQGAACFKHSLVHWQVPNIFLEIKPFPGLYAHTATKGQHLHLDVSKASQTQCVLKLCPFATPPVSRITLNKVPTYPVSQTHHWFLLFSSTLICKSYYFYIPNTSRICPPLTTSSSNPETSGSQTFPCIRSSGGLIKTQVAGSHPTP